MKNKGTDISALIEKGLKIMFSQLVNKAIKEDKELVVTDNAGNPIRVKATTLKHLVQ